MCLARLIPLGGLLGLLGSRLWWCARERDGGEVEEKEDAAWDGERDGELVG